MKIPDPKAAVDKEWKSSRRSQHVIWKMSRAKEEAFLEAQRDKNIVHFATLMDICHFKNAELEPKLQTYKGRAVLRGDNVEDDSGAYAVLTEQGSSASEITAAKMMDVIAKITEL